MQHVWIYAQPRIPFENPTFSKKNVQTQGQLIKDKYLIIEDLAWLLPK